MLEVSIELHFKMHMVVHLSGHKREQRIQRKDELEVALYIGLESTPKI